MQPAAVQFIIREEQAADREGIRQVHRLAFKTDDEGALVDRLRADGLVVVSMTSKARQPYEIVVNQVNKDQIAGYLATPKVQNNR